MSSLVGRRTLALLVAVLLAPGVAACSASAAGSRVVVSASHCPGVDAEAVRCRSD